MSPRIIGIVLLVVGILLLGFGLNATESFTDAVNESVTGRYTDETMLYLIGGAVATISGLFLALRGSKARGT
jgi:hypothetical protein